MLIPVVDNTMHARETFLSLQDIWSKNKYSEIMYDVIILNHREQKHLSQSYQKYYLVEEN